MISRCCYDVIGEISACVKIDNQLVGQTQFKSCSQQCWDHRMSIDLDRARELEIAIYWKDYRSVCSTRCYISFTYIYMYVTYL